MFNVTYLIVLFGGPAQFIPYCKPDKLIHMFAFYHDNGKCGTPLNCVTYKSGNKDSFIFPILHAQKCFNTI